MVLFIFFNCEGHSVQQWKSNPFDDSIKSGIVSKVKKFGEVYMYNPLFYNFNKFNSSIKNEKYNKEFKFDIKTLDLEEHCKKLFTEVYKIDSKFILISHSLGYIFAHTFANMYDDNIEAIINIDGGCSKEWVKRWLDQDKIEFVKKIKNRELNELFINLERGTHLADSINLLNLVVRYNILKQYYKNCDQVNQLSCCTYIFHNIDPKNSLCILDKFKFCNEMTKINDNVKIFNYLEKNPFLYFDIEKDIVDVIKLIIDNSRDDEMC